MNPLFNSYWQIGLVAVFVFEWAFRITMLFIVPRKRHPSSATAWLLLIMISPIIGTVLFLLIGSPKLNKIRRAKQTYVSSLTDEYMLQFNNFSLDSLKKPYDQTALLAQTVGGLPPVAGNHVEVVNEYTSIFKRQADLIDRAGEYVHIEYFIFVMDDDTECIFKALESASSRGVKVRVLFDYFSRYYPNYKNMLQRFKGAGIEYNIMLPVTFFPSKNFNRPDLRNHRKLLVVDGQLGSIGSANLVTDSYHRKDELRYEEMAFMLEGPVVWQLNTVFRSDWYAETDELIDDVDFSRLPKPVGTALCQVLPSGPGHAHENNLLVYAQLFHAATKKITIVVPYFVPDETVVSALIAAAKRGVEVCIINSEIKDKLLVGHAQRSFYEELLEVGIKIYLYKKPVFLHNKQVSVDDEVAVVGSSNLDIRSFELNQELSLIIYDEALLSQLTAIETDYKAGSIAVTLEDWQARSKPAKLLDSIARITSALQ